MTKGYKKKLIEVALPLEAINAASAREKSIRHGHPSTLHLWWARRPLAACRAVLFAQLVDDPSEYVDKLLKDPKISKAAKKELTERTGLWKKRQAEPESPAANTPKPTLEDCAADVERKRLFKIIEDLVKWENSTNEEVLERARAEIRRSCNGELPPVYDPFSGGCSIPLEAQRLGLPAYGSDLNPVAVMIGKAMIEIPPRFRHQPPVHPGPKERTYYRFAEGLAEDVKHYGNLVRESAIKEIGHLYPQVDLPTKYGGGKATVIAWIWARTVPSPDPAFSNIHVPLVSSFLLSSKSGQEIWIEPNVDRAKKKITFRIRKSGTKAEIERAKNGTKSGRGANFVCLLSDTAITANYIRNSARSGEWGQRLIAVVAEGNRGRVYVPPHLDHEEIARTAKPESVPSLTFDPNALGFRIGNYGMSTFGDMFTNRQILALNIFTKSIKNIRNKIKNDVASFDQSISGSSPDHRKRKAEEYADAVSVYLAFGLSKIADYNSNLTTWISGRQVIRNTFGRPALPMAWDFAETNVFSNSTGNWSNCIEWGVKTLGTIMSNADGREIQCDAQSVEYESNSAISTDPPYYDNIGYADLSDFFYCWLKPVLGSAYPDIFGFLATPKVEELVATPSRHGGRDAAESFFLSGMSHALSNMAQHTSGSFPTTVYYAFKQSEIEQEGISSTGWATFLEAVVNAGYAVTGTWPLRTEMANRMRATGSNALANSVVLVCRKKETTAETITRAEFLRILKRERPPAIAELQIASIAPADMPQSAIGPGMGVFSRYHTVLEADDSPMTVKTALQLINHELDEYLGGIIGEFDAETRFAITWFEQNGMSAGEYGTANNIATARGVSVDSVKHAGIVESSAGKVRILRRDELEADWDPQTDTHLTIWECLQYLIRQHEREGIAYGTAVLLKKIGDKADAVKDLAYYLYDISANKRQDAKEATAYNALIADWTELTREAATISDTRGDGQARMDF